MMTGKKSLESRKGLHYLGQARNAPEQVQEPKRLHDHTNERPLYENENNAPEETYGAT